MNTKSLFAIGSGSIVSSKIVAYSGKQLNIGNRGGAGLTRCRIKPKDGIMAGGYLGNAVAKHKGEIALTKRFQIVGLSIDATSIYFPWTNS